MRTADQTMDQEVVDRLNRFQRLSAMQGVTPPQIEVVTLPPDAVPGATRPIPVIRVTFAEQDFFGPGSTVPRPAALRVLGVVAENMRRDVPDVRVTVLGHTDASGTDPQNLTLSQGRAQAVLQSLVASGVNPGQLTAVAIGRAQPIAPNSTAAGRARNRRVEFLISPYEQANFDVVTIRPVNRTYLSFDGRSATSTRRQVAVLKPYSGPADVSETATVEGPAGGMRLASAAPPLTVGAEESGSPVSLAARSTTRTVSGGDAETGSPVAASFTPGRP